MGKETKVTYTDNDRAIVNALKGTDGLTLAEIKEATGLNIVSGHIVSAMKKGLIASIGEKEVMRPAKRLLTVYSFVNRDPKTNKKGETVEFTEGENKVLDAAETINGEFILADLAEAMGVEKLSSGSINGLVKNGNIAKADEKRTIVCERPDTVKVYGFVADIPND